MQRSEDLRVISSPEQTFTVELHNNTPATQPDVLDPIYTPLLHSLQQIHRQLQEQHENELEKLKLATANQTETLYQRLTEAREHVVSLTREFDRERIALIAAQDTIAQQTTDIEKYLKQINALIQEQQAHQQIVADLDSKHEQQLNKLKSQISSIQADFAQQISHLESKLNFQMLHHEEKISLITQENLGLSHELAQTRHEIFELNQTNQVLRDNMTQLQQALKINETNLKDKSDKLLRTEHSLKLAHEELSRSQAYVHELEEKNNAMQKELFENWMKKDDSL